MMLKSMLSIIYKNFIILNSMYIIFELYIVYLFNIYIQNVKLIQYIKTTLASPSKLSPAYD